MDDKYSELGSDILMNNPWAEVGDDAPYVYPPDLGYIEAFNRGLSDNRYRLETAIPPSPIVGRRDAPLVVLEANPWLTSDSRAQYDDEGWKTTILECMRSDDGIDFFALRDRWSQLAGGRWWRQCFAGIAKVGPSFEELAERVMSVDFHGYHSENWSGLPVTLPSQQYGFDLVRQAVERDAIVVLMRARRYWMMAVPELNDYENLVHVVNVRTSSLSPRNLVDDGFDKVIRSVS